MIRRRLGRPSSALASPTSSNEKQSGCARPLNGKKDPGCGMNLWQKACSFPPAAQRKWRDRIPTDR